MKNSLNRNHYYILKYNLEGAKKLSLFGIVVYFLSIFYLKMY
jgi:hypothetical protein